MSWRMGVRVLERVAMRPVIEDPQSVADVLAGPPRDRLLSSRGTCPVLHGGIDASLDVRAHNVRYART